MRKILSLILALALVMSMGITAFAAEGSYDEKGTGDYEIDISAAYQPGDAADEIISVDIAWGEMSFTYHAAAEGQWSATDHAYTGGSEAHWDATGNTITVTNHSNTAVKATFTYTQSVTTVTGTFNHATLELPTAVNTTYENAPSGVTTLTLDGSLTAEQAGKVGTVTVAIAKNS